MRVHHHPLLTRTPCTRRELISLHYGQAGGAGEQNALRGQVHKKLSGY